MKNVNRPLSPFLSIYRPQFGSMISIMGRITGVILAFTLFCYLFLLYSKESLLNDYNFYSLYFYFYKGSLGDIIVSSSLLFILLNLVYHNIFSIRFLNWAYNLKGGKLPLDLEGLYNSTFYLLLSTFSVTFLIWILV